MKSRILAGALVSTYLLTTGCSSSGGDEQPTTDINDLDKIRQVLSTNADLAYAAYADTVTTTEQLKTAIDALVANPTGTTLANAKKAWLVAREPYEQTEVFRFRNGPIDDDKTTTATEDGPEGSINAWPLGEALIDYVKEGTDFGADQVGVSSNSVGVSDPIPTNNIIETTGITIDAAMLDNNATASDERDVISGYHALEFLLWGQDLNAGDDADTLNMREAASSYPLDSGGHRPVTDFYDDTNGHDGACTSGADHSSAANDICTRRNTYLAVAAQKLIDDLTSVRDAWAPAAGYRTSFTTVTSLAEGKSRLLKILTGMGTLSEGELAGERIQIALSSGSQEEEHSCFSDNTHRDILLAAEGVYNSYHGTYPGYDSTLDGTADAATRAVSGYGIDDYLREIGETALADDVAAALASTRTNTLGVDAKARAGMPFDVLIENPTGTDAKPVRDTILSLTAQSVQIARVATELDLGSASDVVDPDATACNTSDPTSSC